jgi:DNA-binding XRE family transcriptional regulator
MSNESLSMKQLRQGRRREGKCAQCPTYSRTYLCQTCRDRRLAAREKREQIRLGENRCIRCGKNDISKMDDRHICEQCIQIYPNLPIRKLRTWTVKNHRLYQNMMKKPCTTKELALIVGVNERTVCRWVFHDSVPKRDNANKAARYFGREVKELFPRFNETIQ